MARQCLPPASTQPKGLPTLNAYPAGILTSRFWNNGFWKSMYFWKYNQVYFNFLCPITKKTYWTINCACSNITNFLKIHKFKKINYFLRFENLQKKFKSMKLNMFNCYCSKGIDYQGDEVTKHSLHRKSSSRIYSYQGWASPEIK